MRSLDSVIVLGDEMARWERQGVTPDVVLSRLVAGRRAVMHEALDAGYRKREEALKNWEHGLRFVGDAAPEHGDFVHDEYVRTIIPVSRLRNLPAQSAEGIAARKSVMNQGGFLHVTPPDINRYLGSNGVCKIMKDERGEPAGFYTVLCDDALVQDGLQQEFGWHPALKGHYTKDHLPNTVGVNRITWLIPDLAAQIFNHPEEVALPGDLVIKELPLREGGISKSLRDIGLGKALKVAAYQDMRRKHPRKKLTLTRIFEIVGIGDRRETIMPLSDSCTNKWSRHMNQNLGATHVGTMTEQFMRRDDATGEEVWIEVNWGLYKSSIEGLIETAYSS